MSTNPPTKRPEEMAREIVDTAWGAAEYLRLEERLVRDIAAALISRDAEIERLKAEVEGYEDAIAERVEDHHHNSKIHEQTRTERDEARASVAALTKVIDLLFPAAIWFNDGPYGNSPDPECTQKARAMLAALDGRDGLGER